MASRKKRLLTIERQQHQHRYVYLGFLVLWLLKTAYMHCKLSAFDSSSSTTIITEMQPHQRTSINRRNHAAPRPSPLLWKSTESQQVTKRDRNGHVVHHEITKLTTKELQGLAVDNATTHELSIAQASAGRERLLELLEDAGVHDMEAAVIAQLPTWKQVADLYYSDAITQQDVTDQGPVLVGLDTCARFRETTPADDASVGVAGLFNTGTNPLAMYLSANCEMPANTNDKGHGMRWQVPWGKHMMAIRKWNNTAANDGKVKKENVLPVVLIRDPYTWMQSMCKHPYAAKWEHAEHCPNLINAEVTIRYPGHPAGWKSLVQLWSDFYNQYKYVDYPRLMVRFEDLIFRPKELVNEICTCAGAVPKTEVFSYVVDAGKWGSNDVHKGSSNMVTAMIKYGSAKNRLKSLTESDQKYAHDHLDSDLMELFQYQTPPIVPAS